MAAPEVSVSWLRAAVEKKGKLLVSRDKIDRQAVGRMLTRSLPLLFRFRDLDVYASILLVHI
eukprot:scaffold3951_cov111-Skeletonema_dohrnii-CCMP3373.AAC.1